MKITEIRRLNLRRLIDQRFDGKTARCAAALDLKPPQLHRWLSTTAKSRQNMHEDSARAIEKSLDLPDGWMDRQPVALYATGMATEDVKVNDLLPVYLSPEERALIDNLRHCDEEDANAIKRMALRSADGIRRTEAEQTQSLKKTA